MTLATNDTTMIGSSSSDAQLPPAAPTVGGMTTVQSSVAAGAYRVKRPQSSRLRRKIDDTYSYFQKKVDPIVSLLVTQFLSQQPIDVLSAMKLYFVNMRDEEVWQKASIGDVPCYEPLKDQKMYFTQDFGPILSKIVDSIAASQPQSIVDFVIDDVLPTIVPPPRPSESTARSKLNDAITLASAIAVPSDSKVELLAARSTSAAATTVVSTTKITTSTATGGAPGGVIKIQISMLGLGGSGKSSIIKALQGDFDPRIKPSLGFKPVSMQLRENTNVTFYDLGGGKKIRDIWAEYHHDVHGVVYVFDASLTGAELDESVSMFHTTVGHEFLTGKPLLVVANKLDIAEAISAEKLSALLGLDRFVDARVVGISSCVDSASNLPAPFGDDAPEGTTVAVAASIDPRYEVALEYLLDQVINNFSLLDSRVKHDTEKKKAEEAKKRLARERKVLRNRIAMAFGDQIKPELMPENLPEPGAEDTYSRSEAIDFIAGEIAVAVPDLDPAAIEIVAMVGYQRLAMQIVGALKAPINKKKVAMEWHEIREMIAELRLELGLPELPAVAAE